MIPHYVVRRLSGEFEELPCFRQLEDESAALYFNVVHGAKLRRRFTTEKSGKPCGLRAHRTGTRRQRRHHRARHRVVRRLVIVKSPGFPNTDSHPAATFCVGATLTASLP
jgi:hypothetical protein